MHEHVPVAQRREDAFRSFPFTEGGRGGGHERWILQLRAVQPIDLPQRREVQQPGHLDDVTGVHVELAQQQLQHVLGHVVGDLEAHRRAETPARQLSLERLQQIFVAIFLDLEIRIASDAERVVLDDLETGEQHRQERRDQFLHRQKARFTAAAVELDEAIDVVGHFDSSEVLTAVVGGLDGDREIQAQPTHERERMRRVDGKRCQHREDLLVEVGRQPFPLGVVELIPRDDDYSLVGEGWAHRVEEHMCAPISDLLSALTDPTQLFAGRKAVG
jgi:hypothetical protein